jgi:hypothetical protein
MAESPVSERIPHRWYARPVFFVSDVRASSAFTSFNALRQAKDSLDGD